MAAETIAPTSRAEQRAKYLVEEGIEIPPTFASSIFPWGEIAQKPGNSSFFIPVFADPEKKDDTPEDAARRKRPSVQNSGNNFYDKRGMDLQAVSRVMQNVVGENGEKVWGVRSWAIPVPKDESEAETEE